MCAMVFATVTTHRNQAATNPRASQRRGKPPKPDATPQIPSPTRPPKAQANYEHRLCIGGRGLVHTSGQDEPATWHQMQGLTPGSSHLRTHEMHASSTQKDAQAVHTAAASPPGGGAPTGGGNTLAQPPLQQALPHPPHHHAAPPHHHHEPPISSRRRHVTDH